MRSDQGKHTPFCGIPLISRGPSPPEPAPDLDELRTGRVLGVDLNANHLATCVLDSAGNPIGDPTTVPVDTAGLSASHRDGRVRAAITALLDHAEQQRCNAVVVENLDFADARATGRETLGRGRRGKRFRRTVAGIHILSKIAFMQFNTFSTCSV